MTKMAYTVAAREEGWLTIGIGCAVGYKRRGELSKDDGYGGEEVKNVRAFWAHETELRVTVCSMFK
jgi:hypothetical protein